MVEDEGIWETLIYDNDYEIYNQYPYPIRRTKTGFINTGLTRSYIHEPNQR